MESAIENFVWIANYYHRVNSISRQRLRKLEKMGIEWIDPWEKPLHDIYNSNPCLSPVPSLAVHCANINSVFGVSPFIDLKRLWGKNID